MSARWNAYVVVRLDPSDYRVLKLIARQTETEVAEVTRDVLHAIAARAELDDDNNASPSDSTAVGK